MNVRRTRTVFTWMLREEWRMHSHLFGGRRFAAFPLFVTLLAAGTAEFLVFAGTDFGAVVAGFHALVFAFGLHTGSIGFVGRDAQENVLPTGTLLVFTGRTLPLSRRYLIAVFLVKDAVFYVFLFLLPLTVGFLPAVAEGRLAATAVPVLWVSIGATFLLGTVVTFAAIALSTRGIPGWVAFLVLAGAAGLLLAVPAFVGFTPYAIYADGSAAAVAGSVALLGGVALLGFASYDPSYERPARSARNEFRAWNDRLSGVGGLPSVAGRSADGRSAAARRRVDDGLLTKSLLDVRRSSGGIFKLFFSGGILFVVSTFLIDFAGDLLTDAAGVTVTPSTGVSFGAILGLTAFTTYNWLTSVDSPGEYLPYPVSVADVFRAKFRAFLILGPPVGVLYYAIAALWLGIRPLEGVVGLALLLGLMCYLFGVTVYLTGFSPNEFLFDTLLFAAFFVAVAAVTVPVLITGFVLAPLPPAGLGGLTLASVALGSLGLVLYRRAVPRWTRIHRRGEA
ncbi:hypothetical protein BRD00_14580 [Halobacteriales archaeon QS_8_69_26]|nr:MAG: hypothetical protein BRD00_14580 [Halobacteriales archaeon QS_8_69_26]